MRRRSSFQRSLRSFHDDQWCSIASTLRHNKCEIRTMCAFSTSLKPSSGSGGSCPCAMVSKPPCSTPTTFSLSSKGEWVLSLSLCFSDSFMLGRRIRDGGRKKLKDGARGWRLKEQTVVCRKWHDGNDIPWPKVR